MVRGKKDMSKDAIMASIKILSGTTSCKKPLGLRILDKVLAGLVYSIIIAAIVIPIILIL